MPFQVSVGSSAPGKARLEWIETLDDPRLEPEMRSLGTGSGFGDLLTEHCLSKMRAKLIGRELTQAGLAFVVEFDAVTLASPA